MMPARNTSAMNEAEHQRQSHRKNRRLLPGPLLPLACPNIKGNRTDNADGERDQHPAEAVLEDRLRDEQSAIVEKDAARDDDTFPELRQRLEHGVVPEQQLQQQRQ